jgi:Putative ATPase subunit of terminase (gpP-like)
MQNEITKPQTKPPIDRESVRVLAIELGAREAARRLGLNEDTVCSWARRYKWQLPQRKSGRPCTDLASTMHTQPGDILLAEQKSLEAKTKTGLSRAVAKAAEHASTKPPLEVTSTAQLRDLAAAASRVFAWNKNEGAQVQINQLCISTEQLQQIRALREQADAQESPSDTPGRP